MSEWEYGGPLGQTLHCTVQIGREAGHAFEASITTQVNAKTDPAMRDALVDGTVNTVEDPEIGESYKLAVPVLFHDPTLRLFALVIPDSLRHRELQCRRDALDVLGQSDESLPSYVRNLQVVFGGAGLAQSIEAASSPQEPAVAEADDDLSDQRRELEAWQARLEEKEAELEAVRANLDAAAIQETRKQRTLADQSADADLPRESTSVVRRPEPPDAAPVVDDGWGIDGPEDEPVLPAPSGKAVGPDGIPTRFDTGAAGSRPWYHSLAEGVLVLSYRLSAERMARFAGGDNRIYLQFHDLEEFPLVCIMVVPSADEGDATDDIYWPLDVRRDADRKVLKRLSGQFVLKVAIYGEHLGLHHVIECEEPLELNALHLLGVAERRLSKADDISWEEALRRLEAPDYKRLGDMRHNFHHDSFRDLDSPSEVRLATGIVGYWSGPELFRYLIENLSFSLASFAAIQERVVTAAVRYGLALSPALRQLALEMELAEDESTLCRMLLGTWSELCLGLSAHKIDLDEVEIGLVWQEHLEVADALGETLDDDVITMAAGAIRRAQENQDGGDWEDPPTNEQCQGDDQLPPKGLAELNSDALISRLTDDNDRLMACIVLLDRAETKAVSDVMGAAEKMTEEELDVFSEHLVGAAAKIENELIDALTADSGTVTWLCGFALASIPSSKGLPVLLDLVSDPGQEKGAALLAETLMPYGEGLLDQLLPRLTNHGAALNAEHPLMGVLRQYIEVGGEPALDRTRQEAPNAAAIIDA
jgi:hypothetical protein